MAAGGSGCTSSAGGGSGGRGVNPRRSGRCVRICVRCVRGGEDGGVELGPTEKPERGVLLVPSRGFVGAAASPRASTPPPAPSPPSLPASGGFFPTGRRECGRGRPGRGRAAELRLSHCVFCLFFSPKVPFPSVRRPAGA